MWDLDKNKYSHMKMRWLNTLQREWHPDVALVFQGTLSFDPDNPTRFYRATKLLDQFVWHHLNLTGSIMASHLANSIEHARKTGAIVASNGKSLIEYLDNWVKITDADEARRAREALLGLQVQPKFTLVELEETYRWAEAIIQRLPASERTAECNIRVRFLEGMKGELAPRKIAVESQLATLTALGHTITDASFIQMIGTQLAAHRLEMGVVSANSETFQQPGVETKVKPNVNVMYHREQGDRDNQEGRRCFACNGLHTINQCDKGKCEYCDGINCGIHFPNKVSCIVKHIVELGWLPDNVKGADGLDMPANHKYFLIEKARRIKQKMGEKKTADEKTASEPNEQSNVIYVPKMRDMTASEIRAMSREDEVCFYINNMIRSPTKRAFDEANESTVGDGIEVNDASNEQCAICPDAEEEEDVEVDAQCGNGGPEQAAKPGKAAPANYPFWEIKPVAPGEPTATEACDRPVHETNPDDVQGDKRVTESGGHETESIDMNWEDG
jgi:hypothetical protein